MERNSFLIVAKAIAADTRFSATTKLLLAQLQDHQNKRTGQCNPKQTTLARELGIGERTVRRGLSELRQRGLITAERGQTGCRYEIPTGQNGRSDRPKVVSGTGQNGRSAPPGPLYEPYVRNQSGASAASSPNKKPLNASAPPRKSVQSEVLEAYYREERRKASR